MSQIPSTTTIARRDPAVEFRLGVQADAARYLIDMLGSEQGKRAGARVAIAFAAAARAAKDPAAFYDCSRASIVTCIANSALTEIMPGGAHPLVWLVPKKGELQWWLSHRGISVLAMRAGYQVMAIPIHVDDHIKIQFGEVVEHEPADDAWPTSLADMRGCYLTIRRLSDGVSLGRPWMPIAAIERRRKAAITDNVWTAWPVEQAQKTVVKWAMARGYIPVDGVDLQAALNADHETSGREEPLTVTATNQPERRALPAPSAFDDLDAALPPEPEARVDAPAETPTPRRQRKASQPTAAQDDALFGREPGEES